MAVYVRYNSDNSWLISLPAFSTKPLSGMTEFCLETSLMKLYSFEICTLNINSIRSSSM